MLIDHVSVSSTPFTEVCSLLLQELSIIHAKFKAGLTLLTYHPGKGPHNYEVETINSREKINITTWRCLEIPTYSVLSGALNGTICLPGQVSIFSKNLTGTTPSKPSVKITLLSEM